MKSNILFFLIFTFIGCSKETTINPYDKKIIGVWFNEDTLHEYNRISKLQYNFKEDNTVEILRVEMDINSMKVLGYRYKSTGNYSLDSNQLSFSNLMNYTNDDTQGSYSAIEDLKLIKENNIDYTVTCKFEKNGKKLTLIYPPCGELANCIGSETFCKE